MSDSLSTKQQDRARQAKAFMDQFLPLTEFDIHSSNDGLQRTVDAYVEGSFSQASFDEMTARILKRYEPRSDEEIAQEIAARRTPALMLNQTPTPDAAGAQGCWLGGLPTLPADVEWPMADLGDDVGIPMHFIAQIDLGQVPRLPGLPAFPQSGTLFFFFLQAWYMALDGDDDQARRVIYTPDPVSDCPPRAMPAMPDLSQLDAAYDLYERYEDAELATGPFRQWNFDFHPFEDVSQYELRNRRVELAAIDENHRCYQTLRDMAETRLEPSRHAFDEGDYTGPVHQLFGSHYELYTGSPFHLLSIEPNLSTGFLEDMYSIDFVFADQEARDSFDVSRVNIKEVCS